MYFVWKWQQVRDALTFPAISNFLHFKRTAHPSQCKQTTETFILLNSMSTNILLFKADSRESRALGIPNSVV